MTRILVLLALLWAVPASATEYFVSKTTNTPAGSDSRSCATSSVTAPLATIAKGITCLGPGHILTIRGGTYDEYLSNNFVGHAGTSWATSDKVIVRAYGTETVTLAPTTFAAYWVIYLGSSGQQYIEFTGINLDSRGVEGGFRVESSAGTGNPHHIRFQQADVLGGSNFIADESLHEPQAFAVTQSEDGYIGGHEFLYLTVHGGGDSGEHYYGFYINADNTTVDHCELYNLRGIALQVYSAYSGHTAPLNVTVSNNKIHDITASAADRSSGLIMDSGNDHLIYNNIIYGLGSVANGAGIRIYGARQKAYNNTIYGGGGTGIDVRSSATDAVVTNNISYGNSLNFVDAGTRTVCSYNDGFTTDDDSSIACTNSFLTNPDFTNAAAFDFSIKTTSPAKNTGTTVALVTVDYAGTARPQSSIYDIGAYEFTGVAPDPDVDTPAAGTTFVSDTFTGASVALTAHVGETGATWATQTGASAGMLISNADRLRGNTIDVTTNAYASGTPVSAEYDVNVPVHTFTTVTGHVIGVWGRMLAAARTGYVAIYNLDPGQLQLWVVNNYVYTQLGASCTPSFADASDHTIRLEIRDAVKKLYYDSTLCTKSTDNSVTAPGLAGVDIYTPTTAATNSTSFHFSSITAIDVQTAVVIPPQVTVTYRLRFKR